VQPVRPKYLDIDRGDRPEAKVQAWIVAGIIAGLADYSLGLFLASVIDKHT
jgi:hypothetical protein